jgi:hypothetical protein
LKWLKNNTKKLHPDVESEVKVLSKAGLSPGKIYVHCQQNSENHLNETLTPSREKIGL